MNRPLVYFIILFDNQQENVIVNTNVEKMDTCLTFSHLFTFFDAAFTFSAEREINI